MQLDSPTCSERGALEGFIRASPLALEKKRASASQVGHLAHHRVKRAHLGRLPVLALGPPEACSRLCKDCQAVPRSEANARTRCKHPQQSSALERSEDDQD